MERVIRLSVSLFFCTMGDLLKILSFFKKMRKYFILRRNVFQIVDKYFQFIE
jgi:hypothetical protein